MQKTLFCLLLAACGGEEDRPQPVPDETTPGEAPPDDPAPPVPLDVACTVDPDNTLRYRCSATTDPPASVTLTLQKASGGDIRTYVSPKVAGHHAFTVWLIAPLTEYAWEATTRSVDPVAARGAFTTGQVPDGANITFALEGTASFPYLLAASACAEGAYAVIASTEGEVLWYHGFEDAFYPSIDSLSFTEDGTILAIVNSEIIEVDLYGNELMRLERFVDFEELVHHDVFRKDGYTWALQKYQVDHAGEELSFDGFYVFDPSGVLVADWRLYDHFQPPGPVNGDFFGTDYSHANSLWVDETGDVLFSMRHLSAIAYIEGDLASPDFGTILWRMSGDPNDPDFGTDFALTSAAPDVSPTFEQQHNVHFLPDGTLTMFDNRLEWQEPSRLLHLSYDLAAGAAVIEAAYPLPLHCEFQGGAWHTAGGNPVATCAPQAQAYEFDLGVTDTPRWTADMDCVSGAGIFVPRVIPLEESDL